MQKPPWDTGISPPELLEFLDIHPPGRALDLGCGTGTNAITMAKRGWQVTGIDFAIKAIATARCKASAAHVVVDLRVGDVTRLDGIYGPYNLILDIGCYHNLDKNSKQQYTANIKRLLAPGGTFLLYALCNNNEDNNFGLMQSDIDQLNSMLQVVRRVDSNDRRLRHSAWFTYRPR